MPEYVVAREPVTLTFTVRQHGVTRLDGLKARVDATAGRLESTAAAAPGRETGQYTATLVLPQAGAWTITIHSGYHSSSHDPPAVEGDRARQPAAARASGG